MADILKPRPGAIFFVLGSVALDVMALGLIIPVLPKLVEQMAGTPQQGALMFGLFGTAWALMQLVFSPVLGALSDAVGRRPVLLLSSLGLGLDYILMALAPDLLWLFVGRVISGIASATYATAGAYITDITPPDQRAARFGLLGAAFGLGFVLGPAIGGLLGATDPRLPFWVAAGLSLACAAYGWLVLPESLPPRHRTPFAWRRANPVGSLRLLASSSRLAGLSLTMFLSHVAHAVFPAVFVLHAGYRLGWGPGMVGLALAVFGVCATIVQGGLIKPAAARLSERSMLLFGMACGIVGLLLLTFAASEAVFWLAMPILALWGFTEPAAQGLMSRLVGPDRQGQLQGAGASLIGVANLVGPGLFTSAFAVGIAPALGAPLPGAPYLLAAVLLGLGLLLVWRLIRTGAA